MHTTHPITALCTTGQLDGPGRTHINRPEILGPLLLRFLGLPYDEAKACQ